MSEYYCCSKHGRSLAVLDLATHIVKCIICNQPMIYVSIIETISVNTDTDDYYYSINGGTM